MVRRAIVCVVCGAAAAFVLAASTGGAGAYTPPPVIPWETLLAGLPTASEPQFHGGPGCPVATMKCIDTEISRLDKLRRSFGCDHRAVFATTYELLTEVLRASMRANPHLFRDPRWLIGEDATFANLYFTAVANYDRSRPVPSAWQVAFGAARSGDDNAVQDMLLGINAHVQRDMPFMLAAVGLHARDGSSHKSDHDVFNAVLNEAYQFVVDTIARRFDPVENLIAPGFNPVLGLIGNISGDQVVQGWREQVWRNAELLLDAPSGPPRDLVLAEIEGNAQTWAQMISQPQFPPGYRAQRDAWCAKHNRGPLPPVAPVSG